jgi:hypothetical protein
MLEDTVAAIHQVGHRKFVGGDGSFWERISCLQFEFLVSRGLKPSDQFVDIGCGSLRGGHRFIEFLEPSKYHGIDKYIELILYGVNTELGMEMYQQKMPRFVVSDQFEFTKFDSNFTFALAQSLFTHLNGEAILDCLKKLSDVADVRCRLFSTFFETMTPQQNPRHSHSQAVFSYTRNEMELFGSISGWEPNYIGEWDHPRGQRMIEYVRLG